MMRTYTEKNIFEKFSIFSFPEWMIEIDLFKLKNIVILNFGGITKLDEERRNKKWGGIKFVKIYILQKRNCGKKENLKFERETRIVNGIKTKFFLLRRESHI